MKVLSIMRGIPGSGKSTKAKTLSDGGDKAIILSTDDYFVTSTGEYIFFGAQIPKAHAWNQERCRQAMRKSIADIVIDNTNTQAWEAKPYVLMAQDFGYTVQFVTADTPWAFDADECARRNTHGVPLDAIKGMLSRWEPVLTVESCLASKAPWE